MHIMHHSETVIHDAPYDPAANMAKKTLTVSNNSAFTRPHHNLPPASVVSPTSVPADKIHRTDDKPVKGINFRVESLFSKSPSPLTTPVKSNHTDMDCSPVAPASPPPQNSSTHTTSSTSSFASHSVENILAKSSTSSSSSSSTSSQENNSSRCTSPTTQTYTWNASSFPWMQTTRLSPSSGT